MNILDSVRVVPDFPKPGIQFYDIATLLSDPPAWRETISQLREKAEFYKPDMLMGIESRGFLVAAPLAMEMGVGFGMIRKKGKLPGKVLSYEYDLEYGSDVIELQADLVAPGSNIVLVDDLLATGGTMGAAVNLVEQAEAKVVASLCIIELEGLGGRDKISCPFEALLQCPA